MGKGRDRQQLNGEKNVEVLKLELPCEYAGKVVIPSIRALIVKTLVEDYKLTKYRAAKILGLTPAAVTYYLSGERGRKLIEEIESDQNLIRIVKDVSALIAERNGINSVEDYKKYRDSVCKICAHVNIYAKMAGCHHHPLELHM